MLEVERVPYSLTGGVFIVGRVERMASAVVELNLDALGPPLVLTPRRRSTPGIAGSGVAGSPPSTSWSRLAPSVGALLVI